MEELTVAEEVPKVNEIPLIRKNPPVIPRPDYFTFCTKHKNTYKGKCGCK
jgi:hypothetical protein